MAYIHLAHLTPLLLRTDWKPPTWIVVC